jgi:type II secretory pathway pseudopilin PulG
MNVASVTRQTPSRARSAFALTEVIVAVGLMAIVFVSLYLGMSSGFAVTKLTRENLRATQIMLERLEGLRLYNWNQLCYSNMIPASFTTYYYPSVTNGQPGGVPYYGTISVGTPTLNPSATYADRMRAITVTLVWTNATGATPFVHRKSMTTYSARDGVQNYVYNN